MFQERLQMYECDNCRSIIPKSKPVRFHAGNHFCGSDCMYDYLEKKDEDREWQDAADHVAVMGNQ